MTVTVAPGLNLRTKRTTCDRCRLPVAKNATWRAAFNPETGRHVITCGPCLHALANGGPQVLPDPRVSDALAVLDRIAPDPVTNALAVLDAIVGPGPDTPAPRGCQCQRHRGRPCNAPSHNP